MPTRAPATEPSTITAKQLTALSIALAELHGTDHDAQTAWINEHVSAGQPTDADGVVRPVESRKELSEEEARRLLLVAQREKTTRAAERELLVRESAAAQPEETAPDGSTTLGPLPADIDEVASGLVVPPQTPEQIAAEVVARLRSGEGLSDPGSGGVVVEDHDVTRQPPVQEAVRRVMEDIGRVGVGKNGRNEKQNYAFRGIDDFVNSLSPILARHGVILLPKVGVPQVTQHATSGGGKQFMIVVRVKWSIVGPAGDRMTAVTLGQAMDTSDKAANKAMSAAYKYVLGQVFAVPNIGWAEGDSDHPEAAADPVPPAQASEEDQQERWSMLARLNAIGAEIGKSFEELTAAKRRNLGGMSVEEFRAGPLSGLRAYLGQCEAYLVQQAQDAAAAAASVDGQDEPGQDPNDA